MKAVDILPTSRTSRVQESGLAFLVLLVALLWPVAAEAAPLRLGVTDVAHTKRSNAAAEENEPDFDGLRADIAKALNAERTAVDEIVEECADLGCWVEAGRERGLEYIVLGHVLSLDERNHEIEFEVVSTATARTVASVRGECEICGDAELRTRILDLAATLRPRVEMLRPAPGTVSIAGNPVGAKLWIDGELVGELPWSGELDPGPHELRVEAEGFAPWQGSVKSAAGVVDHVSVQLSEVQAEGPEPEALEGDRQPEANSRRRALVGTGAALMVAGAAATGTGIALLVLDGSDHPGSCTGDSRDINGACPNVYSSLAGGASLTAVGGVALITGAGLLIYANKKKKKRQLRAGARVGPDSAYVSLSMEF